MSNFKQLKMKKKRFTEAQIFNILKEFDADKNIQDLSREHTVSKATIFDFRDRRPKVV
jgi:putative transposase